MRRLGRMGVVNALRRAGVKEGDPVRFGEHRAAVGRMIASAVPATDDRDGDDRCGSASSAAPSTPSTTATSRSPSRRSSPLLARPRAVRPGRPALAQDATHDHRRGAPPRDAAARDRRATTRSASATSSCGATGPTYTADTLDALAGERLDDEFWFIVGADALADLPNWHEPERIVRHAIIAVTGREGADVDAAIAAVPARSRTASRPSPCRPPTCPRPTSAPASPRGEPIDDLVPAAVAAYISEHRLYA